MRHGMLWRGAWCAWCRKVARSRVCAAWRGVVRRAAWRGIMLWRGAWRRGDGRTRGRATRSRCDAAWRGVARRDAVWHDVARFGTACRGVATHLERGEPRDLLDELGQRRTEDDDRVPEDGEDADQRVRHELARHHAPVRHVHVPPDDVARVGRVARDERRRAVEQRVAARDDLLSDPTRRTDSTDARMGGAARRRRARVRKGAGGAPNRSEDNTKQKSQRVTVAAASARRVAARERTGAERLNVTNAVDA